jgi:predicted nucleic acid-binding protein
MTMAATNRQNAWLRRLEGSVRSVDLYQIDASIETAGLWEEASIDQQIAATDLHHNLVLVTDNHYVYSDIPGLALYLMQGDQVKKRAYGGQSVV